MDVAEVYEVFVEAGVPDEKEKAAAQAASEEQLSTKADIHRIEGDIHRLERVILAGQTFGAENRVLPPLLRGRVRVGV